MTRFRAPAAIALAAGLVLAAGTLARPKLVPIQPTVGPAAGQPIELPVVPRTAAAFVSLRVSDLVDHPDLRPVVEQLKKSPDTFDGVTELVGVAPHEIDRVTLFWPAVGRHGPGEPVLVVTTREAYNEARVLKAVRAEPVFADGPGGGGRVMPRDPAGGVKGSGGVKGPPKAESFPPPVGAPKEPPKDDRDDHDGTVAISTAAPADPLFYHLDRGPFRVLFLIDDRTLVFLPDPDGGGVSQLVLISQLMQRKATGPLAEAIAAGGTHTLAAGVYLPPVFAEFDRRMPPELAPYAALTAARTAVVTGDLGKTARLTLKMTFDDAAAARRAAPVLEEGLRALAEKAAETATEFRERVPGVGKVFTPLFETAAAGLKKAAVKTEGSAVTAAADFDIGPAVGRAAVHLLQMAESRKKLSARTTNLKQIGLALHNYNDVNNKLPTNVYGPKGEPLLSWRVHLLPYLEQDALYRQFRMNEPWDSEHNKKLVEQMPKVFEVAGRDAPKGKTYYQAFLTPAPRKQPPGGGPVGRTWLVEGGQATHIAAIPDGTSNTFAVVEARDPVAWSKPDDLPFGEKVPPLGAADADRFLALFLDGSVRAIPTKTRPEILRLLIDGQDGQVIPDVFDDDRPRGFPFGGRSGAAAEVRLRGSGG